MYKTVVTSDHSWLETRHTVSLYKDYTTYLNIPVPFRWFTAGCGISIVLGVCLGVLIHPGFLMLLMGILLSAIPVAVLSEGEKKGWFRPMRRSKGSEKVSASSGSKYKLLDKLDDVMRLDEVDTFSDRQLLASEVFNLVKVYDIPGSDVGDTELLDARDKLFTVQQKALKQRQAVKLAGITSETPGLDMAVEIDLT